MSSDPLEQIHTLVPSYKEKFGKGMKYLKENGLNLILQLPSPKELLQMMEERYKKGEIDKASYQQFKSSVEGMKSDVGRQFSEIAPKFEPKDALARPLVIKSSDGRTVQMSTNFMDCFSIYTTYDIQRMIRNSSIILTGFTGPMEKDNFGLHLDRLRDWMQKHGDKGLQGFPGLLEFMISFMIVSDMMLLKWNLPNREYYEAAIIIGNWFKLF